MESFHKGHPEQRDSEGVGGLEVDVCMYLCVPMCICVCTWVYVSVPVDREQRKPTGQTTLLFPGSALIWLCMTPEER